MLPDGIFREGIVETLPPYYSLPVIHEGTHVQNGPLHGSRIERVYPKDSTILGKNSEYAVANTVDIPNPALFVRLTQEEVYAIILMNILLWPSRNLNRWG